MINYDQIRTRKGLFPDGSWQVEAAHAFLAKIPVSKEQFDEGKVDFDQLAEQAKHQMWDSIYGDLYEPLKKLEQYAIRNALPGDEKLVGDICDKLNKLLRLP